MIIVGITRTDDGFVVVDSEKREHICVDERALWSCLNTLATNGEAEMRGATHDEIESRDVDSIVDEIGRGVGDFIGVKYGETLGDVVGRTSRRSGRGFVGFLRRVSRK